MRTPSQSRDSRRTFLKVRGQDTDLINYPREKFVLRKTPGTGPKKRLTSGGRMGSPQAAHLGANTLGEKQRSRQVHTVVFLEGKAKCFWETCSWACREPSSLAQPCLRPALSKETPPALVQRGSQSGSGFSIASGLFLSRNEHICPLRSTRDRDCLLPLWRLAQAQAHRGGWRPAESVPCDVR